MNDYENTLHINGKDYTLKFTLNVMEEIQEHYGTVDKWAELTDGAGGEPNAKALIFGFTAMLNEGMEIKAEEMGEPFTPLSRKQVGRLITQLGIENVEKAMKQTVIESAQSVEKNV